MPRPSILRAARWGEKATYSINNDGITLHLNGADDLGLIQR
ncbi:hypothetical protein, partial [Escherichia coli]